MARWLVTGADGLLGPALCRELRARGHDVVALGRSGLDITDREAVARVLGENSPDVVVNAAAYTAVDAAETDEVTATRVNGLGPELIARACAALPRVPVLLQPSTDYVFDGTATRPYDEDAPTAPATAYGRSKLVGEEAVRRLLPEHGYVVRTAWLYGVDGPNFVATMLRLEREGRTVDVVDDQQGQPTSCVDLADRLADLGEAALAGNASAGIYHGTSSGRASWFELARAVFELVGADPARVRPIATDASLRPAPRPAWSVLAHGAWATAGLPAMPPWRESLERDLPALVAAAG